jgi:hypothetical protein
MTDATNSDTGLDPDRASFTIALNAARDQGIHAAGIIADTVIDLVGNIGHFVLDDLLPERLPALGLVVSRATERVAVHCPP